MKPAHQQPREQNAVGAIGIVALLAALAILKTLLRVEYLPATALAVEIALGTGSAR